MDQQEIWQVEVQGQIYEGNLDELTQWIAEGALQPYDRVRRGNLRWLEAGKIPALYGFFNARELGGVNPPVVTTTSGEQSPFAPAPSLTIENQLPPASAPGVYNAPPSAAGQNPFNQPPPPPQFSENQPHQSQNFQSSFQPVAAAPKPVYTEVPDEVKSGANWYFWIAGLSLVNSLIMVFGGNWAFITGLAVTQIVDAMFDLIARESGSSAISAIGFLINLLIAAVFVTFGVFGRRGAKWAFIVGMILYALDGAVYLLVGGFLGVLVHGFALFCLFRGWQASRD